MWTVMHPVARTGPVGRYAPSPTGDLHLGNLRTALLAWKSARDAGGVFILRIEDIDKPRSVPGSEERILDDLRWLGLDWDEGPDVGGPAGPYRQSERDGFYDAALGELRAAGRLFACTCSRRDLREASAPHGPEGPVYKGNCRGRTGPELDTVLAQARGGPAPTQPTSVRFRVDDDASTGFLDAALGRQEFHLAELSGDFVVRRRDRLWAYQLACAVDDALMGITHVVRGADLLTSTPRQIAIIEALGLPAPRYEHIALVADADGRRMSKRDGSLSLARLRAGGLAPAEVRELILSAPLMPSATR